MDTDQRQEIKAAFQADPSMSPVRILLATDAASEGIDLQLHCHRLVHYEIPWNPNRLEQRNGRIDRHGQRFRPLVYHFAGVGGDAGLDGDQEFLCTVVEKVEEIRTDLGSVGPVIADQIVQRMLGRRRSLDTRTAESTAASRRLRRLERNLREEVARLHERLLASRETLHLYPANVERVVRVGLELAGQQPLLPAQLERRSDDPAPSGPVWELPP